MESDILPSDEAVLELLSRKRSLLAELSEVNAALRRIVSTSKSVPFRPRADSDNDWAREQIAAGRDYDTVYTAWLSRRNIAPSAHARDAFRKAISRKPGSLSTS